MYYIIKKIDIDKMPTCCGDNCPFVCDDLFGGSFCPLSKEDISPYYIKTRPNDCPLFDTKKAILKMMSLIKEAE